MSMAGDRRTHGLSHEAVFPMIIQCGESPPGATSLRFNYDVAKHLFPMKGWGAKSSLGPATLLGALHRGASRVGDRQVA
jgi:hypothetical protein